MPVIARNRNYRAHIEPPTPEERIGQRLKRCGYCSRLWLADDVVENMDGEERCPNDLDNTATRMFGAMQKEIAAEATERYILEPFISQARLVMSTRPAVTTMEDAIGGAVEPGHPLRLVRGISSTLVLRGIGFSSDDTIESSDGITIALVLPPGDPINPLAVTLSVIADVSMLPGLYPLIFNDDYIRGVLLVR